MSKIKLESRTGSTGTYEARLAAAQSLKKGDRVRHQRTGEQGSFQEINLGFALPEVWVHFDSDREISKTLSCNPLDLETLTDTYEVLESSELVTTVIQSPELSDTEVSERHRLELKVERAFYEAGVALRELRDKRLYRSTHKTFEEYCTSRFGFTRANATYLIAGATVVDNLKNLSTNGLQILPTSERQVRPLTRLEPDMQVEVWQQAVQVVGNKVPPSRIVRGIVEQLKQKPLTLAADYCSVGDAFILTRLEGPMRKYNGCWAIASWINDFTIVVDVHDTTLTLKPEHLQPIDEPNARRQLPQTLKRIRRLRNVGMLDRCAYTVLESLGRQTYLTDLEAEILIFLEQRYGISD